MWRDLPARVRALARSLTRGLWRRSHVEDELDDEVRFHLETRADAIERSGVPRDQARRQARLEFGAVEGYKERCREARGLRLIDELRGDTRDALRGIRRSPVLSATTIVTLALVIGACTAVFSVANWLYLRPVPGIREQGRVVAMMIGTPNNFGGVNISSVSYENLARLRATLRSLDALAGFRRIIVTAAPDPGDRAATPCETELVTQDYFPALGVPFVLGRPFTSDEDRWPDVRRVAVISEPLWEALFDRRADVIGAGLRINNVAFTIVGVAGGRFQGFDRLRQIDLWLPGTASALISHQPAAKEGPGFYELVARLRPGATVTQAQAEAAVATPALADWAPERNAKFRTGVTALVYPATGLSPLGRRTTLTTFGLVTLLLGLLVLLACANIASLFIVRAGGRPETWAIRKALGARAFRIVRAQLVENTFVALAGGAAGLVLGRWLLRWLDTRAMVGTRGGGPAFDAIGFDWRVFAFTAIASLATALIFGLLPALTAARVDPAPLLTASRMGDRVGQHRLHGALTLLQIATAFTLLVALLFLVQTVRNMSQVRLGFDPTGLSALASQPGMQGYSPERARAYYTELLRRLSAEPGVTSAALNGSGAPFVTSGLSLSLHRIGPDAGTTPLGLMGSQMAVSPGYFRTLRIALLRGRDFDETSWGLTAQTPVVPAIVNQALASALFGSDDVVGRLFGSNAMTYRSTRFEVIGVAEDHHWKDVTEKVAPLMYLPLGHGQFRSATVLVRSTRPEAEASRAAQRLALAIDPTLPIVEGLPPRLTVARQLAPRLLFARLLGFLSVIAMALATLGLYGAISHTVTQRRRELGLRLALGAAPRIILRSVLGRAAGFLAGGLTLGLAGAAGLMALMRSRLFGIAPTDVATYAFAAGILIVTTIAAAAIPARAAARIDPARTLRNE